MEHRHTAPELAAGLHALPDTARAFASTQAAWRFFANPRVTLAGLIAPVRTAARQAFTGPDAGYVLVAHDWSSLNFPTHTGKRDLATLTHDQDRGYELATVLLIDLNQGQPVAPLELRLRTANAVYSTREPAPAPTAGRLDQLRLTMQAIADLEWPVTPVHVIDREADSLGHLRDWQADGRLFVVRADAARRVRWEDRTVLVPQVVATLVARGAFRDCRAVTIRGRSARQWVAETTVVLHRPAKPKRADAAGRRRPVAGVPLPVRLVVSQVRDEAGVVLAEWLLWTNVPDTIDTATVALWYYWRWRIESFFKLLKGAGQQLEQWQQETGAAVARATVVGGGDGVRGRLAVGPSPRAGGGSPAAAVDPPERSANGPPRRVDRTGPAGRFDGPGADAGVADPL